MDIAVRPLDVAAISLYLLGMAVMGICFARRSGTTEAYFVGNRSYSGWVIGLSLFGTSVSSISFLAFPAAAYALDWRQLVPNLTLPLVAVVAAVIFVPFFRRGKLTTAFEYLGDRFGPLARLYGTLSFTFLQLVRLGLVLSLMAIPIRYLTGAPLVPVIIITGTLVALYTVAGGIEAVIWSDVVQAVVLWTGGVLCFAIIIWQLPGGFSEVIAVGRENEKFSMGELSWSLGERTFLSVVLLGVFNWLGSYSSDQTFIQRYAASKSTSAARGATLLYSFIAAPTWTFFFLLGTSVFVFFTVFPDPTVAHLGADDVLPYFILTRIPAGVAGLIIAAILAAAMSSLDSSIHSLATTTVVDLLKPYLARGRDDRFYLRAARVVAAVASLVMVIGAILFSQIEKESMNDLSWITLSLFGGCIGAMFMLGFFTRRVDYVSLMLALVLALALNVYLGLGVASAKPARLVAGGDAPVDGRLAGKSQFELFVDGEGPFRVLLPVDCTNGALDDLIADINMALALSRDSGSVRLQRRVIAGRDGDRITLRTRSRGASASLAMRTTDNDPLIAELRFAADQNARGSTWLPFDVHAYWVVMIVNVVFVGLAYGMSLLRGQPPKNIRGLCVWTLKEDKRP